MPSYAPRLALYLARRRGVQTDFHTFSCRAAPREETLGFPLQRTHVGVGVVGIVVEQDQLIDLGGPRHTRRHARRAVAIAAPWQLARVILLAVLRVMYQHIGAAREAHEALLAGGAAVANLDIGGEDQAMAPTADAIHQRTVAGVQPRVQHIYHERARRHRPRGIPHHGASATCPPDEPIAWATGWLPRTPQNRANRRPDSAPTGGDASAGSVARPSEARVRAGKIPFRADTSRPSVSRTLCRIGPSP